MSSEEVREMSVEDREKARAAHKVDDKNPLKLNSRHRRLMYALVSGMSNSAAGAVVGMTPERVCALKASELFKSEMRRLEGEIRGMVVENEATRYDRTQAMSDLDSEVGRSIEKLVQLRDEGASEGVQQRSAMDLLDRAGVKKVVGVEATVSVAVDDGLASMLKQVMSDRTTGALDAPKPGEQEEGGERDEVPQ